MRLVIVGYGNLGKSLEKAIENNPDLQLSAVYSRRSLDNAKCRPLQSIGKTNDFDVALIALGSYNEAQAYSELLARFDTVDSFDTHAVMQHYKKELTSLNKERISIIGAGWDPGMLSLVRGAVSLNNTPVTVWGRGISQGHSNAIRCIAGVIDAVQLTVPKDNYRELLEQGERESNKLHDRVCYVACVNSDKEDIERQIKTMPNYFADYNTIVKFVTPSEIRQLKTDTSHKGHVYCKGDDYKVNAELQLNCNTDLTAQIMLTYAQAIPRLRNDGYSGALDVFDIPLKYVTNCNYI